MCGGGGQSWDQTCVAVLDTCKEERRFEKYLISTFCFLIKMIFFLLPDKFSIQWAFLINIISVFL